MTVSNDFLGFIIDQLSEWGEVTARRMFGGAGLFRDGMMFMQGELMVPHRINFHKVYDLTERVLPENTDTTLPDPEEYTLF